MKVLPGIRTIKPTVVFQSGCPIYPSPTLQKKSVTIPYLPKIWKKTKQKQNNKKKQKTKKKAKKKKHFTTYFHLA